MQDFASYFVYFGNRPSQPARTRVFNCLAVKGLTFNAEYVLGDKALRRRHRTRVRRKGMGMPKARAIGRVVELGIHTEDN